MPCVGPLGVVTPLVTEDMLSRIHMLKLPVPLLRAAVDVIAQQYARQRSGGHDDIIPMPLHTLLKQLSNKLSDIAVDRFVLVTVVSFQSPSTFVYLNYSCSDKPVLIPISSSVLTSASGVAVIFSCGHNFKHSEFADVIIPQVRVLQFEG